MEEQQLVSDVYTALRRVEYDVNLRNEYINKRDRAIYGEGLFEDLNFPDGHDKTLYNWAGRTVDIHANQVMGRGFGVYALYDKEDISTAGDDPDQLELVLLRNKKRKAAAELLKKSVIGIIKDNGGMARFKLGARVQSAYGDVWIKEQFDKKAKKSVVSVIEATHNLRVLWKNDNYREWDAIAFVYQISLDSAKRQYDKILQPGEDFEFSQQGSPLESAPNNNNTSDPLDQNRTSQMPNQTDRVMVTVIDLTGQLPEWDEKKNVLIVGGRLVQTITDENLMPDYYRVPNRLVPRRANGESDLTDSALDINRTFIERMSDWVTMYNKFLFPWYLGVGVSMANLAQVGKRQRKSVVSPVEPGQDIKMVESPLASGYDMPRVMEQLKEEYVRVTGVGRLLFDDPSVNADSNQALMTTMKGVIDITEEKQSHWDDAIARLFERALIKAASFIPEIKEALTVLEYFNLCVEWPSILRREDNAYQTMWINRMNSGTVSLETYLQKMGDYDPGEEVDRLRDELKDPVTAAILGKQLGEMAHQTISKSLGIPPWGYVIPKVNLKGELAPQETGNMAHNFGWDQGPYGPAIGPTGMDGQIAADNFLNKDFVNGNVRDGGSANYQGPANPQLTTDQNQGQAVSQPGSGAPAVSSAGAVNAANQQNGR